MPHSLTLCYASLQTLLMAHAMCRVSLSTARPSDAQFAFVSHNPGNSDAQLYCHLFRARHARAVSIITKPSRGFVVDMLLITSVIKRYIVFLILHTSALESKMWLSVFIVTVVIFRGANTNYLLALL